MTTADYWAKALKLFLLFNFHRLRNGVKYCKVLKLPEVLFWLLFQPMIGCSASMKLCFLGADSVHSPETLQARGDVLLQDRQPCFLPAGGPQHAAVPGEGQSFSSHHIWPAVSHLSPWHRRKYEIPSFPADMSASVPSLCYLSCTFLLTQVATTLPTVRMWSTASGMSLMTSMSQKSTRPSCRTQKPMCCSTGERS